jgi:hypothetical protein
MARTLEALELGTPVYCGRIRVGEVRGLYAEGTTRSVEWVVVRWDGRGDLAVPAIEIGNVDDGGVTLLNSDVRSYDSLPDFSEDRFPTVRKLA